MCQDQLINVGNTASTAASCVKQGENGDSHGWSSDGVGKLLLLPRPCCSSRAASRGEAVVDSCFYLVQLKLLPLPRPNRDNRVGRSMSVIPAPARVEIWDPSWLNDPVETGKPPAVRS